MKSSLCLDWLLWSLVVLGVGGAYFTSSWLRAFTLLGGNISNTDMSFRDKLRLNTIRLCVLTIFVSKKLDFYTTMQELQTKPVLNQDNCWVFLYPVEGLIPIINPTMFQPLSKFYI